MKHILYLSLFALVSCTPPKQVKNYDLIWNDEFDLAGLPDSTKWSYDVDGNATSWGNNELQDYTRADSRNVDVSNGTLKIIARQDTLNGKQFTSARLISKGKGDWLYGKIEVRAKLPLGGNGTWPAIWMLPLENKYGLWPLSGEIDMMQNVGFDPQTIIASVHTGDYNHIKHTAKGERAYCKTASSEFHIYSLEWEKDELSVFLDGNEYFTFKNENNGFGSWPFDKKFYRS